MARYAQIDFTRASDNPILQGVDNVWFIEFTMPGGLIQDWTGWAIRGDLRQSYLDQATERVARADVAIMDPRRRIIRVAVPRATANALGAVLRGRVDFELYRFELNDDGATAETQALRVGSGRWELDRQVTD